MYTLAHSRALSQRGMHIPIHTVRYILIHLIAFKINIKTNL